MGVITLFSLYSNVLLEPTPSEMPHLGPGVLLSQSGQPEQSYCERERRSILTTSLHVSLTHFLFLFIYLSRSLPSNLRPPMFSAFGSYCSPTHLGGY